MNGAYINKVYVGLSKESQTPWFDRSVDNQPQIHPTKIIQYNKKHLYKKV